MLPHEGCVWSVIAAVFVSDHPADRSPRARSRVIPPPGQTQSRTLVDGPVLGNRDAVRVWGRLRNFAARPQPLTRSGLAHRRGGTSPESRVRGTTSRAEAAVAEVGSVRPEM